MLESLPSVNAFNGLLKLVEILNCKMTECPCVILRIKMCSCDLYFKIARCFTMVAEEGWGFIGSVRSTQVELVVAEQEAEHDHKNLNSEANLTLLVQVNI